jgi:hypothetical protein
MIYFQVMEEEIIRHSINAHLREPAQPVKQSCKYLSELGGGSHIQHITHYPHSRGKTLPS